MHIEREFHFRVTDDRWRSQVIESIDIHQVYITPHDLYFRILPAGKIAIARGHGRMLDIPPSTAQALIAEFGEQPSPGDCAIRLRHQGRDKPIMLTFKEKKLDTDRKKFNVPLAHADWIDEMMAEARLQIHKTRHLIIHEGQLWQVDEFKGANAPLVIAEAEAPEKPILLPVWIGPEVTLVQRYRNPWLAVTPFSDWARVYPETQSEVA